METPGRKSCEDTHRKLSRKIIPGTEEDMERNGVRHERETPVDQGPRDIAHLGELASHAQNPRFDAQHHIKTDVPHL